MKRISSRRSPRAWRAFTVRDLHRIDRQIRDGAHPCCPLCSENLQPRVATRSDAEVVLDAVGYDLDCSRCQRFISVVIHTGRSLRLLRMRRLAAAIRHGARRAVLSRAIRFHPAES